MDPSLNKESEDAIAIPNYENLHRKSSSYSDCGGFSQGPNLIIPTIGLVVHSIADGFALGSATYASQETSRK